MTPSDVLNKYGSRNKFEKETGISRITLSNWLKWGYIPENAQFKLEVITKGELKTQWSKSND